MMPTWESSLKKKRSSHGWLTVNIWSEWKLNCRNVMQGIMSNDKLYKEAIFSAIQMNTRNCVSVVNYEICD